MHTVVTTYFGFLPKGITYPYGAVDTLGYDAYGRVTKYHPAGEFVRTYSYTGAGLLWTIGGAGARAQARTTTPTTS